MEPEYDNSSDSDSDNSEYSLDSEHDDEEKAKEENPLQYIGSENLGHFVQHGCELEPLIGEDAKAFERHLDLDKIREINGGTPLSCDKSYREYSSEYPEKSHVFNSVEILERFLNRIEFEGQRVVVSTSNCLIKLLNPLISRFSTKHETINYSLNDKFWLLLEESDEDLYIEDWEKRKTEPISIELLLKDNVFGNESPVLHESRMFRVMKHSFKHVNLISATEVDALWQEKKNDYVAIKRRKRGHYLEEFNIVFEKKFLGGIQKLVVPVVKHKLIDEVTFVDDIDRIEMAEKTKKMCQTLIANFFDWFHRFVRETRSLKGELRVSGAGIIAHTKKHYAIYSKHHPERLFVYRREVKPRLFYSEKRFNSPYVNKEFCFRSHYLNREKSYPHRCPTINYAQWSDELDDVTETDFLFAQTRSRMSKKGIKNCQLAEYPVMIHFLRSINPDIVTARIPFLPVVAASPHNYHIPLEKIHFHLAVDEPWTCHPKHDNLIVAFESLLNLRRIVEYHEWPSGEVFGVKLIVVLIRMGNVPEETVRGILRRSFNENTVKNARIEIYHSTTEGHEFLVKQLGTPKSLLLVDENSSLTGSGNYDIQMLDDFFKNGFFKYREQPTLIFVFGSEEQYENVIDIIRAKELKIRVRRGGKL